MAASPARNRSSRKPIVFLAFHDAKTIQRRRRMVRAGFAKVVEVGQT
jgi:hypothetical protein